MNSVRYATLNDVNRILQLGREFVEEAPEYYEWDYNKTKATVQHLINDPNGSALVLEVDNEIQGFLLFLATTMVFSNKVVASELAWFVNKDYRGAKGAIKLLKEYERICKEAGVNLVTMSDLQGISDLSNLYKRMGYTKAETSYIKEL